MASKLPSAVLEARGAFDKDPQRRRVDPVATGELGNPPVYLTQSQKELWNEFRETMPTGLAKTADRMFVEITVSLMDRFRQGELTTSGEFSLLVKCLGKLGLSPADRASCAMPPSKDQSNEFSDF